MPELIPATTNTVPAGTSESLQLSINAKKFAAASRATSTRQAYSADWQQFVAWCELEGVESLRLYPPRYVTGSPCSQPTTRSPRSAAKLPLLARHTARRATTAPPRARPSS